MNFFTRVQANFGMSLCRLNIGQSRKATRDVVISSSFFVYLKDLSSFHCN